MFKIFYIYLYYFISGDESQIKEIKFLSVTSYLNSALCNLKSNRHTQAKNDCESALNIEPTNVKAMYRKGEVHIYFFLEKLLFIY